MKRAVCNASGANCRTFQLAQNKVSRTAAVAMVLLKSLTPKMLQAADATNPASDPSPQRVGAALAAVLALCILGAAFVGFIWLTGRQVRRITRKATTKTENDPLWFLKPRPTRLEERNETNPPHGEDLP